METLLIIFAILLVLTGLAGGFLPVLPGPPIAYAGVLVLHFGTQYTFTDVFLWLSGIAMIAITLGDYLLPGFLVKYGKGSRYAVNGANIGVIVGLFMGPVGILFGPFLGALIGEVIGGKSVNEAMRPAFFAFLGFLSGVFLKVAFAIYILVRILLVLF